MIIYQKVKFDAAHRLFGYQGSCNNLHGHVWVVEVWIDGDQLDSCGMLMDYRSIKQYFKDLYDHMLILYKEDPLVEVLQYMVPITVLDSNPTAENLAVKIKQDLKAFKVRIHESEDNFAEV
jgi:6-pyruvoyltetrahydropterin/6-carboxytetrahydropterin synthase